MTGNSPNSSPTEPVTGVMATVNSIRIVELSWIYSDNFHDWLLKFPQADWLNDLIGLRNSVQKEHQSNFDIRAGPFKEIGKGEGAAVICQCDILQRIKSNRSHAISAEANTFIRLGRFFTIFSDSKGLVSRGTSVFSTAVGELEQDIIVVSVINIKKYCV